MSEVFFSRRSLASSTLPAIFRAWAVGSDPQLSPIAAAAQSEDDRLARHAFLHADSLSFLGICRDPREVDRLLHRLSVAYWYMLSQDFDTFDDPYR